MALEKRTETQSKTQSKVPGNEQSADKDDDFIQSMHDWFLGEFLPKYGKFSGYAFIGVLVVILGYIVFSRQYEDKVAKESKSLASAYIYMSENKIDSAIQFLSNYTHSTHAGIVDAKANLLLGTAYWQSGKLDEAIQAYTKVNASSSTYPLLVSGAWHGIAACHMEKKEYEKAIPVLEKLISKFQMKSGDLAARAAEKEKQDLAPNMANALWKLALCLRETKATEKASATLKKLVKVYADTEEGRNASRMLETL